MILKKMIKSQRSEGRTLIKKIKRTAESIKKIKILDKIQLARQKVSNDQLVLYIY